MIAKMVIVIIVYFTLSAQSSKATYNIEYNDGDFDKNVDIIHVDLPQDSSKMIDDNNLHHILNVNDNETGDNNSCVNKVDDIKGIDYKAHYHIDEVIAVANDDDDDDDDGGLSDKNCNDCVDEINACYSTLKSSGLSSTLLPSSATVHAIQQTTISYNQTFITFNNALTHDDVLKIRFLSHCIKHIAPQFHENRKFAAGDNYDGGNSCVYLGGFMHDITPYLVDKICAIASEALYTGSSINNDSNANSFTIPIQNLGIRVIEFLEYSEGMALNWHVDFDSFYTMLIMISSSASYSGGDFMIKDIHSDPENVTIHEIKLPELGNVIINSEHCQPIANKCISPYTYTVRD